MPKGRRERLLELHTQATNNIKRALGDLDQMHTTYEELKPDIAFEVAFFAQGLLEWSEAFERFKKERM
jgi:hypothetical protein